MAQATQCRFPGRRLFQNKWLAFVSAFGARYDGNPALAYVCPTGFMQNCVMYLVYIEQDETNLTALAALAGYPTLSAAYVPAAETHPRRPHGRLSHYCYSAYPVAPFSVGGQGAVNTVRNFGFTMYPGQFGTMYPQAATPPPHPSPAPPFTYPNGISDALCSRVTRTFFMWRQPQIPRLPPPSRCETHWNTQSPWTINMLKFMGMISKLDVDQTCAAGRRRKAESKLAPLRLRRSCISFEFSFSRKM